MKKISLSTQLLLLYTTVTILSAVVFGLITFRNYDSVYVSIAENEMNTYLDLITYVQSESEDKDYLGYITATIIDNQNNEISIVISEVSENVESFLDERIIVDEIVETAFKMGTHNMFQFSQHGHSYYVLMKKVPTRNDFYVFSVMNSTYINDLKKISFNENVFLSFLGTFLAFATIMLVGNIILALWSREMTKRVKNLANEVSSLGSLGYEKAINVVGGDEISELATKVEEMRVEILSNEITKQEMFQNLSHDFKTPIAVIRSYAEALEDGIVDQKAAATIIEQTKKLQKKVERLLEYNKLEYIDSEVELEKVEIKTVVESVLDDYKILLQSFHVIVSLDNSQFIGLKDNYHIVISNIIDNATRYAKSKIIIRLKDNELSFYNDGEPIEEKYLTNLFKPYEKGTKGQFGLGMSIVQKTVNRFGYHLIVRNVEGGVLFKITNRKS